LEIDKILIRYFSSQTATTQKLLYLAVGMDFALKIFPIVCMHFSHLPQIVFTSSRGKAEMPIFCTTPAVAGDERALCAPRQNA